MATKLHTPKEPGKPLRIVFVPSHHYAKPDLPEILPWYRNPLQWLVQRIYYFIRTIFRLAEWRKIPPNSDYIRHVDKMWSDLSKHVFYRRYLNRMEVWRIDWTRSDDMKAAIPAESKVRQLVKNKAQGFNSDNSDVIVFCIGEKDQGNTRGEPNFVQMARDMHRYFIHEFSHSFGGLADEYPRTTRNTAPPVSPNVAEEKRPGYTCKDKWGDMFGLVVHAHPDVSSRTGQYQAKVGCYQNAAATNWYKPTEKYCVMSQQGPEWPYCPVCQRHLEKLMHRYGTGETVVTFDRYPDGAKITKPVLLKGNEFLAHGIAFAPDPSHYEPQAKGQPAILKNSYGVPGNYLAITDAGKYKHNMRNLHITFDWPQKEVTVTFYGATSPYHLEAYDKNGTPVAKSLQNAVLNQGPFQVTVKDPKNRIHKVEFGHDVSITAITELRYR
ncbi:MAG: hypothetical protein GXP40_13485 [Chloroflexi bacterium]|nr:hypothetical protein [Chloroflexota bacterium]